MCRCTPELRIPWCGRPGCRSPDQDRHSTARIVKLEAALNEQITLLQGYDIGSTHWQGCEISHPRCMAIKKMLKALEL